MNFLARRGKRKGFTLVECVVAIAVFALLVTVVMMIIANASNTSKKAGEAETQLNKLVHNVVADNSSIKFPADPTKSEYLRLAVNYNGSEEDLNVSYSTVSGYKNFIKCTNSSCSDDGQYVGDSEEFMHGIAKEDFTPADGYKCPRCGVNTTLVLKCDSCYETDQSKFVYVPQTGGYSCMSCGGGYVHDDSIKSFSDGSLGALSISGITPNGIHYGKADLHGARHMDLWNGGSMAGNYTVTVGCDTSSTFSSNYMYTLSFKDENGGSTVPTTILYVPNSYIAEMHMPPGSNTSATFVQLDDDFNAIIFSSSASTATLRFTLNNSKSNTSFEADYFNDYGDNAFAKGWLGFSGNSRTIHFDSDDF